MVLIPVRAAAGGNLGSRRDGTGMSEPPRRGNGANVQSQFRNNSKNVISPERAVVKEAVDTNICFLRGIFSRLSVPLLRSISLVQSRVRSRPESDPVYSLVQSRVRSSL